MNRPPPNPPPKAPRPLREDAPPGDSAVLFVGGIVLGLLGIVFVACLVRTALELWCPVLPP